MKIRGGKNSSTGKDADNAGLVKEGNCRTDSDVVCTSGIECETDEAGTATDCGADSKADGVPAAGAASGSGCDGADDSSEPEGAGCGCESDPEGADEELVTDAAALKKELCEKEKACEEYLDRLQRTLAEFDNFKKRTAKEKEGIYENAACDIIAAFLPVVDSIERACASAAGLAADGDDGTPIKEGVELIGKQISEILQKLNVEKIPGEGEQFDPKYHDAVMHTEDEQYGKNVVAEVLQVGYLYKDKVVRYSMVKVAN